VRGATQKVMIPAKAQYLAMQNSQSYEGFTAYHMASYERVAGLYRSTISISLGGIVM